MADGTNYPYQASVTITRSGTTATVSHTSHGLSTNDKVEIEGASPNDYNGVKQITVVDANSYTYTVTDGITTPATGTITSTFLILEGLTDVNGEITGTYSYTADQPIIGKARKSSASPYYKTGPITGTVDKDSGASITVSLVLDQ